MPSPDALNGQGASATRRIAEAAYGPEKPIRRCRWFGHRHRHVPWEPYVIYCPRCKAVWVRGERVLSNPVQESV